MKYIRTTAFAALGVAAALSLTACSGDDSGKDSSAKSNSASSSKGGSSSSSNGGSSKGGSSKGGSEAKGAKSDAGDSTEARPDAANGSGDRAKHPGKHAEQGGEQGRFCKVANLHMSARDDKPDAETGDVVVTMTNKGSTTCSVTGFPKVMLKDADNTSNPVRRDHNMPRIANLKPGQSAVFNLSYKVDTSGGSQTHPTDIEVTPPHAARHVSLKWPSGPVEGSYGDVLVHPMHANPMP